MKTYRLGRQARADLKEIGTYIADANPGAALDWLELMRQRFALLATQPESGEQCDELRPGIRRVSVGNYVIYFQAESGSVKIVRVLHGARDTKGLV